MKRKVTYTAIMVVGQASVTLAYWDYSSVDLFWQSLLISVSLYKIRVPGKHSFYSQNGIIN